MALLRALIICAQHLSDWISHFTNETRQFCWTERAAHDQTGHTYGAKTIWPEAVRVRGPFLESPETFRAHFGWHNSLCIFKTKASRGTKLCSYFNFYTLCNIWKDQGPVPQRKDNSIPGINVPYSRDNFIPGITSVPERRNGAIQGINLG